MRMNKPLSPKRFHALMWWKRAFDLACVLMLSPVWVPVALLISVLVWLNLGRPVLFKQPRPGHRGTIFPLWKFRTMTGAQDKAGRLLPDAQRLTPFGQWLRRTSLDELPELINVLRGEMSLVGPRPLLVEYLGRYSPQQARRHEVLPGLTGWAQINGRNAISWEEKFKLDVWYVDHLSLWLDIKIVALTLRKVLTREGVSAPGEATMPVFKGDTAAPRLHSHPTVVNERSK